MKKIEGFIKKNQLVMAGRFVIVKHLSEWCQLVNGTSIIVRVPVTVRVETT